jgi:hypothetical protein
MAVDSLKLQLAVALILSTDQADLDDDVSIEELSPSLIEEGVGRTGSFG